MPSIWGLTGGVNTKQKTLQTLSGGANTKMKSGYALINGVNSKVFSSVDCQLVSTETDYGGLSYLNADGSGYVYLINRTNNTHEGYVSFTIRFSSPITFAVNDALATFTASTAWDTLKCDLPLARLGVPNSQLLSTDAYITSLGGTLYATKAYSGTEFQLVFSGTLQATSYTDAFWKFQWGAGALFLFGKQINSVELI